MNRVDSLRQLLDAQGFVMVRDVLSASECDALTRDLAGVERDPSRRRGGMRNLFDRVPTTQLVADSSTVRDIVDTALSPTAFVVRAILFDKTPTANWHVRWHQDTAIAVSHRCDELAGFGPWSMKAGVQHVRPPPGILEQMVTVRIHLDACPEENGALYVIPGSHRIGFGGSCPSEFDAIACPAAQGEALVMRPLLWHSSPKARAPQHRRILHLEFADCDLPAPLTWHESTAFP